MKPIHLHNAVENPAPTVRQIARATSGLFRLMVVTACKIAILLATTNIAVESLNETAEVEEIVKSSVEWAPRANRLVSRDRAKAAHSHEFTLATSISSHSHSVGIVGRLLVARRHLFSELPLPLRL